MSLGGSATTQFPLDNFQGKGDKLPSTFNEYVECSKQKYDACLDHIDHDLAIAGFDGTLRFHHLKFDGNGVPKFDALAKCLADHLVNYCFTTNRRGSPSEIHEYGRLFREARALLRKYETSGESGELLLFFLLDAVLGAPQLVAKFDLKTNPKLEVNGSDGIHAKWSATDQCLDIYFGESKLEQTPSSAIANAFSSLEKFHAENMVEHEFGLVTSHYKWADPELKEALLKFIDHQQPGQDCRINHACLIGYDWDTYVELAHLKFKELEAEFKTRYKSDAPRIANLIETHFNKFGKKHLRFEMFILPFKTVQEFRDAFIAAVK